MVKVNKSAAVTRIYLPPDVNSLLCVANHCLKSENYFNVIVSDKQNHLQYLDMDHAIIHCTKGLSIWDKASTDQGGEPDVVMACAGDIPTKEALAAADMLRQEFPDLKLRFINVVDLFKLQPDTEHPHGLTDKDFDSLFTIDKPIIFAFHGYPWLIHRFVVPPQEPPEPARSRVQGEGKYQHPAGTGNPERDRSVHAGDGRDRSGAAVEGGLAAHLEKFRNKQIECVNYSHEYGVDQPDAANWKWPY